MTFHIRILWLLVFSPVFGFPPAQSQDTYEARQRKALAKSKDAIAEKTSVERTELSKLLQLRTWRANSNQIEVKARFMEIDVEKGIVKLLSVKNGIMEVPIPKLANEDKQVIDRILDLRMKIWTDVAKQWQQEKTQIENKFNAVKSLKTKFEIALKSMSAHEKKLIAETRKSDKKYLEYVNSPAGKAAIAASKKRNEEAAARMRAKELEDTWTVDRLKLQGRQNNGKLVWMRGCKYSRIGTLYKSPKPDFFHIVVTDSKGRLFSEVFLSKLRFEKIVLGLKRGQEIDIQGTLKPASAGQVGGDFAIDVTDIRIIE